MQTSTSDRSEVSSSAESHNTFRDVMRATQSLDAKDLYLLWLYLNSQYKTTKTHDFICTNNGAMYKTSVPGKDYSDHPLMIPILHLGNNELRYISENGEAICIPQANPPFLGDEKYHWPTINSPELAKLWNAIDSNYVIGKKDTTATESSDLASMLKEAAKAEFAAIDPIASAAQEVQTAAQEILGGKEVIGRAITGDADLLDVISIGFPGQVLGHLNKAGIPGIVLQNVIAPQRTLMRRRKDGQRLTRPESDAAWRLATSVALASRVLNGRKAAIAWLERSKSIFHGQSGFDLIETSVGTELVLRVLRQLDYGDLA